MKTEIMSKINTTGLSLRKNDLSIRSGKIWVYYYFRLFYYFTTVNTSKYVGDSQRKNNFLEIAKGRKKTTYVRTKSN